jgi:hypothetical protein
MEDVTETITDLNPTMNARQFVPRTIPTLLHTWWTNAVFQLNLVLVWEISQGKGYLMESKYLKLYKCKDYVISIQTFFLVKHTVSQKFF